MCVQVVIMIVVHGCDAEWCVGVCSVVIMIVCPLAAMLRVVLVCVQVVDMIAVHWL